MNKLLYLLTRTPLHVGTDASVGAIDQPIQRERHTGYPVIPGSSLKGVIADCTPQWTTVIDKPAKDKTADGTEVEFSLKEGQRTPEGEWLFGAGSDTDASAGALRFSEAKLLAFPIRSAKGGHAWITCPLLLRRFAREGGMPADADHLPAAEPTPEHAIWSGNTIAFGNQNQAREIVLEEYSFGRAQQDGADIPMPPKLEAKLASLMPDDPVWNTLPGRLVILSDGMLAHFVHAACEVMQRNRIDDATGTVAEGALFNQENVPVDTLFFAVVTACRTYERGSPQNPNPKERQPKSLSDKSLFLNFYLCFSA